MRIKLSLIAIIAVFSFSTTASFAQEGHGGMDEGHEMAFMNPEKHFDNPSLKLTKEQKDQIKKVFEGSKPEMQKSRK